MNFDLSGLPRAEQMTFPDRPQTAREWGRYSHILLRSLLTTDRPVHEWEADVTEAAERLKIRLPVTVRRVDWLWQEGRCGTCRSTKFDHTIMLSDGMSPDDASSAIWHELKHAQQIERMGLDAYSVLYAMTTNRRNWFTYSQSPLEREAYLTMNNHFNSPLTK